MEKPTTNAKITYWESSKALESFSNQSSNQTLNQMVANFSVTQYPPDTCGGPVEVVFEAILAYDQRGGFTIPTLSPEPK
eukprot:scaffold141826_cov35-Attheya_sp.AAC.1